MQFDLTGFLIFLGFILPGFVAQKARDSITPRPLKPQSLVADVGEFVLAGVWVHVLLLIAIRVFFLFIGKQHFALFESALHYGSSHNFLWNYRIVIFGYFLVSLGLGYFVGWLQGWFILKQPARNWVLSKRSLSRLLRRLGIPGFLQEHPVWYFVFREFRLCSGSRSPDATIGECKIVNCTDRFWGLKRPGSWNEWN